MPTAKTYDNKCFVELTKNGQPLSFPSNIVSATDATDLFVATKSESLTSIIVGSIQEYNMVCKSNSTVAEVNVTWRDPLPSGLTYVDGSFMVNGLTAVPTITGTAPDQTLTYIIPTWAAGATQTFHFKCKKI